METNIVNPRHKFKNFVKKLLFGFIFCIGFLSLTACQSTNKAESYLGTGSNLTYSCTFDTGENKTLVKWQSYVQNDTIYSISKIHVTFDYYYNETKVETKELKYDISVKNGQKLTINCHFYADGNVSKIVFESWYGDYLSLWDTYQPWWIATIVIVSILALAYVILMIVEDLDLDDTFEFISEHFYLALVLLPTLIISLWGTISSNWVPALIVVGGTVAFVLVGLLAHLVKFIVEEVSLRGGYIGLENYPKGDNNGAESDSFDPSYESIDDYIDDEEKLMLFSTSDLKDYCRDNEIKGFSNLNKSGLVRLIMSSESETNEAAPKSKITKRDPVSKKSKITFDSIAGLDEAKEAFKEKVILPFEHPELFEKFGKKAGGGILLYGLPGTGKTMFAEAASNELNALFIPIKCSDIKSKWYGESEQNVKNIFAKARKAERAIIFFDEFEAIGAKRTDDGNNANNDLVPEILAEMQGVGNYKIKSTIMVIAATNKPWAIDSAFMRPGRFDEKIYIPLPDAVARKKLFEIQLNKLPVAEDLDYDYLAKITEGFNGADIKEVCEKLKMSAIKDSLAKGTEQTIGMDDVSRIEKNIKSSVSQEDIIQLNAFEEGLK